MENMAPWVGTLKQITLVFFACLFAGLVLWTYIPRNRGSLEALRLIPFDDGETGTGEDSDAPSPLAGRASRTEVGR